MEPIQGNPDAVAILAAGIKQNATGRWASTDLTEEDDKLGAPGGALRVKASTLLAAQYPNALIITIGGKGYDVKPGTPEDRPTLAQIMQEELVILGIPKERVLREERSNTTYQQLHELSHIIREHSFTQVALVTSRWHLPRLQAILEIKFPFLLSNGSVYLVSAEDVLIANDTDRWGDLVQTAYSSGYLHKRIEKEEQGIKQIKDGTYNFR